MFASYSWLMSFSFYNVPLYVIKNVYTNSDLTLWFVMRVIVGLKKHLQTSRHIITGVFLWIIMEYIFESKHIRKDYVDQHEQSGPWGLLYCNVR